MGGVLRKSESTPGPAIPTSVYGVVGRAVRRGSVQLEVSYKQTLTPSCRPRFAPTLSSLLPSQFIPTLTTMATRITHFEMHGNKYMMFSIVKRILTLLVDDGRCPFPDVIVGGWYRCDVCPILCSGSDLVLIQRYRNTDCDYSAAYVTLYTSSPELSGHGLTFTIGRGNDIVRRSKTQQESAVNSI